MLSVNCNIKIDLFITIINFIIHSNLAYYLSRIFYVTIVDEFAFKVKS